MVGAVARVVVILIWEKAWREVGRKVKLILENINKINSQVMNYSCVNRGVQ